MKNIFFSFLLILFAAANCPSQWFLQQIDPAVNLFDVRFINKNTGWVCGDNRIFKTTNAGVNWIEQSNPAQALLWQIHPVNENVVYAAGFCTILKTTNGGLNWIALRIGSLPCGGQQFTGLWFINENTGWICGEQVTLRTTNGGETFIDSIAINRSMYDIHFRDDSTGVMAGFGATLRTTNSGANWYEVKLPHFSKSPFAYRESFFNKSGWIVTLSNKVYKTLDYGINWDSTSIIQPNQNNNRTHCVEFSSMLIGYSGCTQGNIFKTTDGGITWTLHPTVVYGIPIYRSIYAYDDNIVWAVGRGKILHTTNGGLTEIKSLNTSIPENIILYQNYPNPFNPDTKIKFAINNFSRVRIIFSDLTGKTISTLIDENLNEGVYEADINGNNISSGVYFYSLEVNGKIIKTKKMILKK